MAGRAGGESTQSSRDWLFPGGAVAYEAGMRGVVG